MVNLIFDTNTWLYLANGYNQSTNSLDQSGYHFKLLADLQRLKIQGKIEIFTCDIIIEEWNRNKNVAESSVIQLQKLIAGTIDFMKGVKKILPDEWKQKADELTEEYKNRVEENIARHRSQINEVERIIMSSPRIPITDDIRVEVTYLAERKQAPFHNKKNSVGDALILLSAAKYLEGKGHAWIENSIFISNNSDDYCERLGSKVIHSDLIQFFEKAQMRFETNLGIALNSSAEIIKEIDQYNEHIDRDIDSCMSECRGAEMDMGHVWYKNVLEFKQDDGLEYNPSQQRFNFGEEFVLTTSEIEYLKKRNLITIKTGYCDFCSCFHLKCECDEILYTHNERHSALTCNCGRRYLVKEGEVHLL